MRTDDNDYKIGLFDDHARVLIHERDETMEHTARDFERTTTFAKTHWREMINDATDRSERKLIIHD